jgi:hypothetical protein
MGLFGDVGNDSGGGGLMGMFSNPDRFAALAMIAKGLSPHSEIDPQQLMKLAQAQKEHAADRALRERQFQAQQQRAARDDEREDKRFEASKLTPAAKAAMDFGHQPGTEEYKEFMKDFYQLKGQGFTPVTIKENGEERTIFQDKQGKMHTPESLGLGGSAPSGESAIEPAPPGVDAKEWRRIKTKQLAGEDVEKALPGEVAGRLALTDVYLKKAPAIATEIDKGNMTGPMDTFMAKNGLGARGQTHADIQSGTDALRRMLTGAGMPQAEADEYVQRYQPSYRDTATTLRQKHDRLVDELTTMRANIMRGRGPSTSPNSPPPDAIGATGTKQRLRYNPKTGDFE